MDRVADRAIGVVGVTVFLFGHYRVNQAPRRLPQFAVGGVRRSRCKSWFVSHASSMRLGGHAAILSRGLNTRAMCWLRANGILAIMAEARLRALCDTFSPGGTNSAGLVNRCE